MPTPTTYFLNGPSLGSSTSIYTDAGLSVCAPDGFYSDGVIVREQVGCILQVAQECPNCAVTCGDSIGISTANSGAFVMNFEAGAGLGAIIVRFNPFTVPDGIKIEFNSNVYNVFSSVVYGYLYPLIPGGPPIFLGRLSDDCITTGTPYVLPEYEYDGSAFVSTGNTQTITVSPGQKALTLNSPMNCIAVVPKTSASPSNVRVTVYGVCDNTLSSISVGCPVMLNSFPCSNPAFTPLDICGVVVENQTYYIAPVTGNGITLGLYDWIFADPYGEVIVSDGYYKSTGLMGDYQWFLVMNGIIVQFGMCP